MSFTEAESGSPLLPQRDKAAAKSSRDSAASPLRFCAWSQRGSVASPLKGRAQSALCSMQHLPVCSLSGGSPNEHFPLQESSNRWSFACPTEAGTTLEVDSCCTIHLRSVVNTKIFLEWGKRFLCLKATSGEHRRKHLLFLGTIVERYLLVSDPPPENMSFNIKDHLLALLMCNNLHISNIFIPGKSKD